MPEQSSEIVIFKTEDDKVSIDVHFDKETVWLTLDQMAVLFERDKSTISRHIKNVFEEGELVEISTVAKIATVQFEGMRQVERKIDHYNLDVIISVGYRVKSLRGTQFRQWATKRLNEYIRKGFTMDDELFVLNRLVSAFFDLAEIRAKEHSPMHMHEWVAELDKFTEVYGKGILQDGGSVSHDQATEKATDEYRKYQARTLSPIEKEYLISIKALGKTIEEKAEA